MINLPKVSCVTVTKNRVELLKKSIQCYYRQTYKNKELIILSQGTPTENQHIEEYLSTLDRNDILLVTAPQELTLGAMRNLSVEIATGDFICQWDDDDLYHPQRITSQFRCLQSYNVVASCYTQHLKYFSDSQELYWVDWSCETPSWRTFLCGSIMFPKNVFYKFKHGLYPLNGDQSSREEDLNVLLKLEKLGTIMPVIQGYQYVYVYHGRNVYQLEHHQLVLKKKIMEKSELLLNQELLTQTLSEMQLSARVRDLNKVAFEVRI